MNKTQIIALLKQPNLDPKSTSKQLKWADVRINDWKSIIDNINSWTDQKTVTNAFGALWLIAKSNDKIFTNKVLLACVQHPQISQNTRESAKKALRDALDDGWANILAESKNAKDLFIQEAEFLESEFLFDNEDVSHLETLGNYAVANFLNTKTKINGKDNIVTRIKEIQTNFFEITSENQQLKQDIKKIRQELEILEKKFQAETENSQRLSSDIIKFAEENKSLHTSQAIQEAEKELLRAQLENQQENLREQKRYANELKKLKDELLQVKNHNEQLAQKNQKLQDNLNEKESRLSRISGGEIIRRKPGFLNEELGE